METLILGDSIIKYQPTVLTDDHLLKIKVKCFPGINIARLHKTLTLKLVSGFVSSAKSTIKKLTNLLKLINLYLLIKTCKTVIFFLAIMEF